MGKSLLLWSVLVSYASLVFGGDSAWNGVTPNVNELHSSGTSLFTPFYVPPGARAYDSASPLVLYTGPWTESFSSAYVEGTLRSSPRKDSSIFFSFTGTGIEWFGNMGVRHGIADVYIDGVFVRSVDTWDDVSRRQQRLFWQYGLARGRHNIKIVNSGRRRISSRGNLIDLDAFVVTDPDEVTMAERSPRPASKSAVTRQNSGWTLTQTGSTGVNAMQLAIISDSHALIVDKVEHNPLEINGHPAWGALYNLRTHSVKPLSMHSNSFCAGGSFLGNGTMLNVGGNPIVEDFASASDFGDVDGIQAVRLFHPCDFEDVDSCDIFDDPSRIHLASSRWYTTAVRISDGSVMVIGGSTKGGWINNATVNNPTIEYYPPRSNLDPRVIYSPFLASTLNSNLFPAAFSISNGYIFVAANNDAMLYDRQANTERRLPPIPNGVRVTYPLSGTALLLPLSPETDYTSEILICGGSPIDDTRPSWEMSSQEPASAQCSRIILTDQGIARGWEVEYMPQARVMPDAVLLPTGQVVVVNGAGTGIAGYGNVQSQVGKSNADSPALTPVLYNPKAPIGQRFSSEGMPTSDIPRMYHSVATLTPNGDIMIAGSNPNLDRSELIFGTEYRVEWLKPPYVSQERPVILGVNGDEKRFGFGQRVVIRVQPTPGSSLRGRNVQVSLMDLGFVTHGVHANSRLVYLVNSVTGYDEVTVVGPPNGEIYPPGPGWVYVVVDGVPSAGVKVMVGN